MTTKLLYSLLGSQVPTPSAMVHSALIYSVHWEISGHPPVSVYLHSLSLFMLWLCYCATVAFVDVNK